MAVRVLMHDASAARKKKLPRSPDAFVFVRSSVTRVMCAFCTLEAVTTLKNMRRT